MLEVLIYTNFHVWQQGGAVVIWLQNFREQRSAKKITLYVTSDLTQQWRPPRRETAWVKHKLEKRVKRLKTKVSVWFCGVRNCVLTPGCRLCVKHGGMCLLTPVFRCRVVRHETGANKCELSWVVNICCGFMKLSKRKLTNKLFILLKSFSCNVGDLGSFSKNCVIASVN